ncbi:MAG TPA: AmpG family muropeptide MFS transporter [Pseudomonadales bacterium]|nr:AmpG family muropeptide MFS transporter [Pseudomonadales bacterium]
MTDSNQGFQHPPFFSTKMLLCVGLGFTSGLPLYLVLQLVPAWLRSEHIDLKQISLLALAGLPWSWKFIWAPLLDRWQLSRLGKRRSWMLVCQLLLFAVIAGMGLLNPASQIQFIAAATVAVAFLSATQDIALDAFRRELLNDEELGLGNSIHVYTYRLSSLVPGALSLFLADHFSWSVTFVITAAFMLVGMITALCAPEPQHPPQPVKFGASFIEPLQEFFQRNGWRQALLLLTFLFFYKLGDNLATALAQPFYLDMGFSLTEIALIAKQAALWPSIAGGLLGGVWMLKIGINRALWWFGWVQMLSILGYAVLTRFPGSSWALAGAIGFEYFGVGLGTAAFTAFIARATAREYAATQFALLTALATLPRSVANAFAGHLVEALGWEAFFYLCTGLALPGMLLLLWVAPRAQITEHKSG